MRIPGAGDLAPARRRRYGGGYGRRRHQRNVRLGVVVLLLAVAAGGAYLLRHDDTKAPSRIAEQKPTPCPSAVATTQRPGAPTLPAPSAVRLMVLNGTPRAGLAKTVADQLAAQGFVVTGQGNAPKALAGGSTVVFGAGGQPAATLVSRWVQGSHVAGSSKAARGSVLLVLGGDYQRLSTPAEVAAAGSAPVSTPGPAATGCAA